MREKVVFILPFIQIALAIITLSKIPEPPPQYYCRQASDTQGNFFSFVICNPE